MKLFHMFFIMTSFNSLEWVGRMVIEAIHKHLGPGASKQCCLQKLESF